MTMTATFSHSLAQRIWAANQFQADLGALHGASVLKALTGTLPSSTPSPSSVHQLLQAAAFLADSSDPDHRQAAYRIAVDVFSLHANELPNLANLLHVIFGKLGNFPAVDHLHRLLGREKQYAIPAGPLYELLLHEATNTVPVGTESIVLTDFQRGLWNSLSSARAVSVSAPTSAGKSFALQQYLVKALLAEEIRFVLYLVPTRALIHQVSDAISTYMKRRADDILVSTIPQPPSELGMTKGVFVMTQERTHVLLEADRTLQFDMVVVDEAQTIGQGARGILLQVVMEALLRRNPRSRFFFGSPFSRNPEHFDYLFDSPPEHLKEVSSPVSQNLIFADVDPQQVNRLHLSLCTDGRVLPLTTLGLDHELHGDEPTFAYLSFLFGRNSKNLVYSGSPAKCEDVADKIRQWHQQLVGDAQPSSELQEFAKLVREHIHSDYHLADMIEHGIAFHYGKMPTILRKAIEYYFANNDDMRFLVCTSTLLHGVNLPAKNLFILKPSEGEKWLTQNAQPMKSTSFWNLAGRAGRLGKDFEGNVFMVNKAQWEEDPTEGEKEQTIRSSLYELVRASHQDILALAEGSKEQSDEQIESAFVKLFCDYRNNRLDAVLARSPVELPQGFAQMFREKCAALTFTVPDQIIEDNVTISPFRQQRMLDYLLNCIQSRDHGKLVPPHPYGQDAYQMLVRLLSRYEKHFDGRLVASRTPKYLAVIALEWMKGTPYPQLIRASQAKQPKRSLPAVIRDMMDTIEIRLRFKAVQQTRCYIDLLRHALETNNLGDLVPTIPAIPLYLEIGACSGTMVNLIGLGLSRTTAGLLNQKAANRSMDRGQCVTWLRRENWLSSDLPKVCINEVNMALAGSH
ncbi:MAG: DEAD/DEAH box helicase [Phycisphaerales bacterium]